MSCFALVIVMFKHVFFTCCQVRTAFKRCIGIPIADVERVKNDWEDFERSRKLQNKGEVITKAIVELVRVVLVVACAAVDPESRSFCRSGLAKLTAPIEFKWQMLLVTSVHLEGCFQVSVHLVPTL